MSTKIKPSIQVFTRTRVNHVIFIHNTVLVPQMKQVNDDYVILLNVCRDTYPVFLNQLQQLSSLSSGPHSLGQLESRRVSALLGLIQAAISVAAVTPDQLNTDKQNGIYM